MSNAEMSDIVEKSCKSMRPSLLVASATPVNTDTFVSPFQDAPKTLGKISLIYPCPLWRKGKLKIVYFTKYG